MANTLINETARAEAGCQVFSRRFLHKLSFNFSGEVSSY